MNPAVLVFLILALFATGILLEHFRKKEEAKAFQYRVPQWPEWLPVGEHVSQTIYEGKEYQLSLHLAVDNQWYVILTTRTKLGIRTLSSEGYSTHRAAKSDWKRIYQLLPDAFDLPLEEMKA